MNPLGDGLGFTYQVRKSGEVAIFHHGAAASVLRGARAAKFLSEVESGTEDDAQQLMARLTGNYKRGNERLASRHAKNSR
jgi:hypothetical protein